MDHNHDRNPNMSTRDYFARRSGTTSTESHNDDEDLVAEVDEPPDHHATSTEVSTDFHKSAVKPQPQRKESLLTMAFATTSVPSDSEKPAIRVMTDVYRRRSAHSVASATSTVDLTSDGGITSPARTNTPSPPFPPTIYTTFPSYTLDAKTSQPVVPVIAQDLSLATVPIHPAPNGVSQPDSAVEALVRKRCISFACGQKPRSTAETAPLASPAQKDVPKRTIKFACSTTRPVQGSQPAEKVPSPEPRTTASEQGMLQVAPAPHSRHHSRSPSATKKHRPSPQLKHRDSASSTVRRYSKSPVAARNRRATYISVDETTYIPSEATRFHEFASDEPQEDDWIRKDASETKEKITINDTLKKELAIRRLGEEAEQEALQDEEDEDDDEEEDEGIDDTEGIDSDYNEEEEDDEEDVEDEDEETIEAKEAAAASDGNETDNEAGFADSDDESDGGGDYQFWTPGRSTNDMPSFEPIVFRTSARRTASESSIDSLKHMSPIAISTRKSGRPKTNRIRIRPGTPDLPDSTDFVCGTLDEDRPLEDAYVSCMEARRREKHYTIPQDIDPSFPTSDPENEEDNDDVETGKGSDDDVWFHGKFEDSDDSGRRQRRIPGRKSPKVSPKRLHSPPPPTRRLHSPPPPKNRHRSPQSKKPSGGTPPKRVRSPLTTRSVSPPAASTANRRSAAITFEPLGRRPGLTHTKSLPRTPNAFCRAYRAARLVAANGNIADGSDSTDLHTRGAIDIVKGLEHKRQRRKEKHYQKHCNRARKGLQVDRRPLPGKGAERMRELGLQMAGKTTDKSEKAEFVLSV